MNDITYVGLDVHKATVCVAIAESGRGGEVREVGVFENRPDVLRKMVARLGKQRRRLNFCYEAGPCGYGLHRLLIGLGHDCVVAPSLIPMKAGDRIKPIAGVDAGEAASCRRTDADLDTRRCS
jgi:transposase